MSNATKRIPVTEERWRELHELKQPGQTFDELIEELLEQQKKANLFEDLEEAREQEFVPLEEV